MDISEEELKASVAFLAAQKEARQTHRAERKKEDPQWQDKAKVKVMSQNQVAYLERSSEVWRLRLMGVSIREIAERLDSSEQYVVDCLHHAGQSVRQHLRTCAEVEHDLELERTSLMLQRWMEVAMMDNVTVERIRSGDAVEEQSVQIPLKATLVILEILKLRWRAMGLLVGPRAAVGQLEDLAAQENGQKVLGWLKTEQVFIRQMAQAAPKDVLTLEVNNDIDSTKPNGSDRAGSAH